MSGKHFTQLFDNICQCFYLSCLPATYFFPLLFWVQVIHAEVSKFHNEFQRADSLDDMIHLHNVQ